MDMALVKMLSRGQIGRWKKMYLSLSIRNLANVVAKYIPNSVVKIWHMPVS